MLEDYEAIMNMTDKQAAEVLEKMRIRVMGGRQNGKTVLFLSYNTAMQKAIQKLKGGWIPITTRDVTPEEIESIAEEYPEVREHPEDFWKYTCPMPGESQDVLITTKWGVCVDHWYVDVDGHWFEEHPDRDEVLAWMPFPRPYKEEEK